MLCSVLIVLFTIVNAQNLEVQHIDRPKNNISLNLLGDASIISVNYERIFVINSSFFVTGKVGFGYNKEFLFCLFGSCNTPDRFFTIPHHITGNLGKGRHFFEFGYLPLSNTELLEDIYLVPLGLSI